MLIMYPDIAQIQKMSFEISKLENIQIIKNFQNFHLTNLYQQVVPFN